MDAETNTETPKSHKDSDTKTPTGKAARDSAERQDTTKEDTGGGHHDPRKNPTGKTAKGHARRRARDHRRRSKTSAGEAKAGTEIQRSKKDAETYTEMPKAHTNSDTKTPTGKPARGSAERQDKGHSRKSAKNLAERVKKPTEENTSSGDSNPRVELRPDGNTKTPNRDRKTQAGTPHEGKDSGPTGSSEARDHEEGGGRTKTSTERHRPKEDGETHTGAAKTLTGSTTKALTGVADEGAADLKMRAQGAQEADLYRMDYLIQW